MSETCCARVNRGMANWPRYEYCGRSAKFIRDGKFYCGVHDPVRAEAKAKERRDKWNAQWDEEEKKRRLANAAPELLAALKDLLCIAEDEGIVGDKTTLARAHAAIAKVEGG